MATYADLTAEQKADLAAYDKFLRSLFAALARVGRECDAKAWNTFAQANVDPVLASLDAGEEVPNSTGYAGAKPLTKAEFLSLQGIARGLEATREANLPLTVKAVGVNA